MAEPSAATPSTTQEQPQAPQVLCSMCPNAVTNICNVCRCTRYCSKVCQKDDWPVHKLLCKSYKEIATPPSPNHFRAIFFSDDENKLRFIWVEIAHGYVLGIGRMAEVLCFDTLPLRYRTVGPPKPVYHKMFNPVLKRSHKEIDLYARLALDEYGNPKLSGQVTASVGSIDRELMKIYCGPLLFHGNKVHLDIMSSRHIIDEMRDEYHHEYMHAEAEMQGSTEGVRINCTGDRDITGRPEYESMKHTDEVFTIDCELSIPVADKIGLPLHVFQVYPALTWRGRSIHGDQAFCYHDNRKIQYFNPAQWSLQTASICLIRKDKKPLHVAHIEALFNYCVAAGFTNEQLFHVPGEEKGAGVDMKPFFDSNFQASAKQILARAAKEDFSEVFAIYMVVGGRKKYGDVPSPYDI